MNEINDICIQRFKPDEETITCSAINWPWMDGMKLTKKDMEFNCGSLPPQDLHLKIGCYLMLLRNWKLSEGM